MESSEKSPLTFDDYVLRVGMLSAGLGVVLLAWKFLEGCGGLVAGLLSIVQVLALIPLLWLPLFWGRIKDHILGNQAAKWALFGSLSPFAVLLITMIFDTTGKHGCFR
jgi:hypothetical protein